MSTCLWRRIFAICSICKKVRERIHCYDQSRLVYRQN